MSDERVHLTEKGKTIVENKISDLHLGGDNSSFKY